MMQIFKHFTLFWTLLITAAVLTGCENYADKTHPSWVQPPPGAVYDDSTIYARIMAAIQSDAVLQGSHVEVKVTDGNVLLTGTVTNDDQMTRVNMHSWIVDGVKKVDNQIIKK
ncbi:MAG: BON domain-containing protein [Nitrosomonas sp.]